VEHERCAAVSSPPGAEAAAYCLAARDEARRRVKKVLKPGRTADSLHGRYEAREQQRCLVDRPDPSGDTNSVLLRGRIEAFIRRVLPYARCLDRRRVVKIGYEISFTRYFYKPPLRIWTKSAPNLALEKETTALKDHRGSSVSAVPHSRGHIAALAQLLVSAAQERYDRVLVIVASRPSGQSTKWRRLHWVFMIPKLSRVCNQ